jgi:uncharacterized protein (TIGR02266 family)
MRTGGEDGQERGGSEPVGAERRTEERVAARFEVRFQGPEQAARALRAYSVNLSAGGLCLRTRKAYAVGAPVSIDMQVEGERFELRGVVAWVRPDHEAVGVRFSALSDEDRARLEQVVSSLRR